MGAFTFGEIAALRQVRRKGATMDSLIALFPNRTRDEIVEVVDACRRHQSDTEAQRHVNHVLAMQSVGEPLINGQPQATQARNWYAARTRPQF